jgi:hypothetical protein
MKKLFRIGFVLALALVPAAALVQAAVDPALLSLVMPDAKIVAGVQVEQAQASALGQYLLGQIPAGAEWDKMVAATGFDPKRDLREIVAASSGARNAGLLIGRGMFQPQRISAMAALAGGTVTNYKGVEMVTGKGSPGGLAFLDASTVVLGDDVSLKSAIDRRAGGGQLSVDLRQKAVDASARNDAWVVTVTPLADLLSATPGTANFQQVNLFQTVQQLAGGLKFGGSTITLTGEAVTRSNEDAQALVDILRFLVSTAQANAKGPNAARASSIIDAAKFSAEGVVMRLTVEMPEKQVEEMIKPPARRNRAAVR